MFFLDICVECGCGVRGSSLKTCGWSVISHAGFALAFLYVICRQWFLWNAEMLHMLIDLNLNLNQ